jgi:periplasmic divalent cation tolerance protein
MQPIFSSYWWQQKITSDEEYLLLIKTSVVKYDALEQAILAAHPYAVPEVIRIPIEAGSGAYLAWIQSVTGASTNKPDGM